MQRLDRAFLWLDETAPQILPLLARLVFAGVLFGYFVVSGWGKIGADWITPDIGAYYQIFPRLTESYGGDISRFGALPRLIILAGTFAEIILPFLIVIGLATRPAALAMIGFILVQSATDIWGHGVDAATGGLWFDARSDGLIADQRAFWLLGLAILALQGAGPLSLDRFIRRLRQN